MKASDFIKHKMLGTPIGRALGAIRDFQDTLYTALYNPENLGTVANDQLATFLVTRLCLSKKVFVDVGAHVGSIVASVMHHNSSIAIIAIEAMPDKAFNLRKKFPSITVHQCAAGDHEGKASFYVNTKKTGFSSLSPDHGFSKESTTTIEVKVSSLDNLITQSDIDVVKIDVEGAELGVVRGAANILSLWRPILMFESGPETLLGYTKEALWQILTAQHYRILVPNRVAHIDDGLSLDGFLESHLYPRRTTNYFALPVERRFEIRARVRRLLCLTEPTPDRSDN